MLFKITETNCWEREKWSYILDMDKQDGEAFNWLMIFVRLANECFFKDAEAAKKNGHSHCFASSRYSFSFYNLIEFDKNRVYLKNNKVTHSMSGGSGYKNYTNVMTDRKMSVAKTKSAAIAIRDKKINRLYKSFESIFLNQKP